MFKISCAEKCASLLSRSVNQLDFGGSRLRLGSGIFKKILYLRLRFLQRAKENMTILGVCRMLCSSGHVLINSFIIVLLCVAHVRIVRLAHLQCESLLLRSPRLSVVCLSRVRSRKLGEIGAKFRHPHKKSGSESKNMTSDFASEVAKYPQNTKTPNSPKWGSR